MWVYFLVPSRLSHIHIEILFIDCYTNRVLTVYERQMTGQCLCRFWHGNGRQMEYQIAMLWRLVLMMESVPWMASPPGVIFNNDLSASLSVDLSKLGKTNLYQGLIRMSGSRTSWSGEEGDQALAPRLQFRPPIQMGEKSKSLHALASFTHELMVHDASSRIAVFDDLTKQFRWDRCLPYYLMSTVIITGTADLLSDNLEVGGCQYCA